MLKQLIYGLMAVVNVAAIGGFLTIFAAVSEWDLLFRAGASLLLSSLMVGVIVSLVAGNIIVHITLHELGKLGD